MGSYLSAQVPEVLRHPFPETCEYLILSVTWEKGTRCWVPQNLGTWATITTTTTMIEFSFGSSSGPGHSGYFDLNSAVRIFRFRQQQSAACGLHCTCSTKRWTVTRTLGFHGYFASDQWAGLHGDWDREHHHRLGVAVQPPHLVRSAEGMYQINNTRLHTPSHTLHVRSTSTTGMAGQDYTSGRRTCSAAVAVSVALTFWSHVSMMRRCRRAWEYNGAKFALFNTGPETCFGWDPWHQMCWDPIEKHISNPDFGAILTKRERCCNAWVCDPGDVLEQLPILNGRLAQQHGYTPIISHNAIRLTIISNMLHWKANPPTNEDSVGVYTVNCVGADNQSLNPGRQPNCTSGPTALKVPYRVRTW